MEKNSTSRTALLPRTTNLATLAVVVAATWWSGAQRPTAQAELAASARTPATQAVGATVVSRQPASLAANAGTAGWPAQAATAVTRDGLQIVSFQTRTR